jgi:hypothetical protein
LGGAAIRSPVLVGGVLSRLDLADRPGKREARTMRRIVGWPGTVLTASNALALAMSLAAAAPAPQAEPTGRGRPGGQRGHHPFDTPDTFEYVGLLHASMGMRGLITVQPRS